MDEEFVRYVRDAMPGRSYDGDALADAALKAARQDGEAAMATRLQMAKDIAAMIRDQLSGEDRQRSGL